jgi:hypothetical protein
VLLGVSTDSVQHLLVGPEHVVAVIPQDPTEFGLRIEIIPGVTVPLQVVLLVHSVGLEKMHTETRSHPESAFATLDAFTCAYEQFGGPKTLVKYATGVTSVRGPLGEL